MSTHRTVPLAVITMLMLFLFAVGASPAAAGPCDSNNSSTTVPGHCDKDGTVVGHYTSVYAYDATGNWYWDLGDGRIQGTVGSIDDLDDATLTVCDYVINYRGDFGVTDFLDNGWIQNHINCSATTTTTHITI